MVLSRHEWVFPVFFSLRNIPAGWIPPKASRTHNRKQASAFRQHKGAEPAAEETQAEREAETRVVKVMNTCSGFQVKLITSFGQKPLHGGLGLQFGLQMRLLAEQSVSFVTAVMAWTAVSNWLIPL
jgi:hypothetical protein